MSEPRTYEIRVTRLYPEHYADFMIEAASEEEARLIATKLASDDEDRYFGAADGADFTAEVIE